MKIFNMLSFLKVKKLPKIKFYSSYCGHCGYEFETETYPKLCLACDNTTFRNPIPVAVGLLPFSTDHGTGLLLIKRAIKPFVGGLCFPGGFVDYNESWREAISREIYEETNVNTDPNEFSICSVDSTPDNARVLIFGMSNKIRTLDELNTYEETSETSGIAIGLEMDTLVNIRQEELGHDIWDLKRYKTKQNDKLCFSIHQKVYDEWFEKCNKE